MTNPHAFTDALTDAVATLADADRRLVAAGIERGTLAPGRRAATPLAELARGLFARTASSASWVNGAAARAHGAEGALARALVAVVDAILLNFPENVFWDLDYLAASLWQRGLAHGASAIAQTATQVITLNERFGCRTEIRFRYVHDFIYGYDWARWVRREPSSRGRIGPFDPAFLAALHERGDELVELIARNDTKYHRLAGAALRNPFGFSREPPDERTLHTDVAERGLLPVEAWRIDASPEWDRPYSHLREERARALGLTTRT